MRRRLGEHLSVYARLDRSVRFATVDEIFEFDPATFARVFSPLDPQVSRGVDLGADYARGDLRLSTSVYLMNLENEIHFNPDTFTNDNLDPTRRRGMLISVAERVAPALRAKADYAYTRAEFREGPFAGNEIPLVARHTGALSLLWDVRSDATVSVVARYTGSRRFDNDESNTFEKIPGRTLVDLEYTQTAGAWRWSAAIHNAFDKEVFDYGIRSVFTPGAYNAYPLPVRNYAVTVGRQF